MDLLESQLDAAQSLFEGGQVLDAADLLYGLTQEAEAAGDDEARTEIGDIVRQMRSYLVDPELSEFNRVLRAGKPPDPVGRPASMTTDPSTEVATEGSRLDLQVVDMSADSPPIEGDGANRRARASGRIARWSLLAALGGAALGALLGGVIRGPGHAPGWAVLFAAYGALLAVSLLAQRSWWVIPAALLGAVTGAVIGGLIGYALYTPDPNAFDLFGGLAYAFWGGVLGLVIGVGAGLGSVSATREWLDHRRLGSPDNS